MPRTKRLFDLAFAVPLAVLAAPVVGLAALAILVLDGRPLLHASPRMAAPGRPFRLWKLRTLAPDPADDGTGVTGPDKAARVTRTGTVLRRTRIDELPQIWNVLRGDMSLVGPRPPLPAHVERFPALFAQVLVCRPGMTGLATLRFHAREARILASARTAEETDALYCRRCLPAKARLDRLYARRRSLGLDLALLAGTAVLLLRAARAAHGADARQ